MTQEEAIGEITYLVYSNQETMGSAKMQDALRVITETTRNPLPDPDTGLMPCGCGGRAKVWPSEPTQFTHVITDYEVGCTECAMTTGWVRGKQENAVKVWNTAMGWKGDAALHTERVDVAPGFDSIRPDGKEHD